MPASQHKGGIFFNTESAQHRVREMILPFHSLGRIISGELHAVQGDRRQTFTPGTTALGSRNQLVKVTKTPLDGQPYRSVSIMLSEDFLQHYYADNKIQTPSQAIPDIILFDKHPLMDSLFDSLLPYFNSPDELPPALSRLKMEEAVTIMRSINPSVDAILGQFGKPGKIDLAGFMEQNFMYNLPMEQFGYLTGRSLTTFKRDFKDAFHTPFQHWITRKRLELAHHQIYERRRKPSDVYIEVGFENLSHFSFAFKKHFGYTPSGKLLPG